ncbi:MAG: DUF3102 domain-containing protein [Thalassobaculum sp.]|uniref:DUF3102 domain-containing protein n=1 Tax=Thalassobaculum sp. TaxID=2022740 RepID=UPI0032EC7FAA
MTKAGDNRLPMLASKINAAHAAVEAAQKQGVEHAIEAGKLLLEAKAAVKHGQWGPWLAEHCTISDRTARLYMQVARNEEKLRGKTATVADLTLRGALDSLDDTLAAKQRRANVELGEFFVETLLPGQPPERARDIVKWWRIATEGDGPPGASEAVAERMEAYLREQGITPWRPSRAASPRPADPDFDEMLAAWDAAGPEARAEFKRRLQAESARQGVEPVAVEF